MPYASNARDGAQIYFEDDGGDGAPVVLHDGFGDSIADLREWRIAQALPAGEFRRIYVDHRGHGESDKPHGSEAYAIRLRVGDAVAVLEQLGIARAHFVGRSWGGRLCFGIGQHAPERVLSLAIGGNQPDAWPDTPLARTISTALDEAKAAGDMEPLARAFEEVWDVRLPGDQRTRLLANDPVALHAAWTAARTEGPVAEGLEEWRVPCLIFIGAADVDFLEGARRAAEEIPRAELLVIEEADHWAAHMSQDEVLLAAVLRTLRDQPSHGG